MIYPKTHHDLDWQKWQLSLDAYAQSLFREERVNNPLKTIDLPHTWAQLTKADRDVYRELAIKLMLETTP